MVEKEFTLRGYKNLQDLLERLGRTSLVLWDISRFLFVNAWRLGTLLGTKKPLINIFRPI
jgi:hypothetical protein